MLLPDAVMIVDAAADVAQDAASESTAEISETVDVALPETPALVSEPEPAAIDAAAVIADSAPEAEPVAEPVTESAAASAVASEATGTLAPPAEPVMIEVWMPGRAVRADGPRRRPRHRREPRRDAATLQPQSGEGAATPAVAASDTAAAPSAVEATENAQSREGRHPRHRRRQGGERHGGDQRHGGERHAGERQNQRHDRSQRDRDRPQDRSHIKHFERRERDKAPDPNSPFAKLAALKAQLEADAKERR
jgi:ATP-dependent RNA helicase SUPV3L1/SUV3